MTPQEIAVIQAAIALVAGKSPWHAEGGEQLVELECAVENLQSSRKPRRKSPFKVCGFPSPGGAMTCVFPEGHVLAGWDTQIYRYHQGFAANQTKRSWREEIKP